MSKWIRWQKMSAKGPRKRAVRYQGNQTRAVKELKEESVSRRWEQDLCYTTVWFLEMFSFCKDLRPRATEFSSDLYSYFLSKLWSETEEQCKKNAFWQLSNFSLMPISWTFENHKLFCLVIGKQTRWENPEGFAESPKEKARWFGCIKAGWVDERKLYL